MTELDELTIKKAINGNQKAFKKLYDHYAPFVWRIVYRTLDNDKNDAMEAVQETFIRIHKSLSHFDSRSNLGTWIYRIAYNTSIGQAIARTERAKRLSVLDFETMSDAKNDTYEIRELTDRILSNLPVEERFLLVSREVDGMSFDEIAEITGQSAGALRTRIHRLKEQIRNSIGLMEPVKELSYE